jgi:hypothetical protein
MTATAGNADRTTLLALTGNLDIGDIADPALRLTYFQYMTDLSDANYSYVQSLVQSAVLSPYPPGNYNKLINGNFDVWQRGTTFNTVGAGAYTTDRWRVDFNAVTNNVKVLQSPAVPNAKSKYSTRIEQMTAVGVAGDYTDFAQVVEDAVLFSGSKVTLSGFVKCDAGRSVQPIIVTDVASYLGTVVNGTGFTKFSITQQLPVSITSLKLMFRVNRDGAAIGAGVNISQAMLNVGDIALPFQPKTSAEELSMCQYYNYRLSNSASNFTAFGQGNVVNATTATIFVNMPRTMRGIPTFTISGVLKLSDGVTDFPVTGIVTFTALSNKNIMALTVTCGAGGMTTFRPVALQANNDGAAFLNFDIEL